jgi:hypothetical protein
METSDIKAFLVGTIGVICGLIAAVAFRRSRRPFMWTLIISPVAATIGCMATFAIWEGVRSINDGHPLGYAVHAGIGAAFLIGFAAPFVCGGPAALVGLALQFLLQRARRATRGERRPPPLPNIVDD